MLKVLLQRCGAIFICAATLIVLGFIILGFRVSIITSSSMVPAISEYGICISQKEDIDNINVGDVISYKLMDASITHRVVRVVKDSDDTYLYTKGDNNSLEDNFRVSKDSLIGKVIYINNFVSPIISMYSAKNITTESVFIVGIVTVLMLVVLFVIIGFVVMLCKAIAAYIILYTDALKCDSDKNYVVYRVKFLNIGTVGRFRRIAQTMFNGTDCKVGTIVGGVRKSLS